MDWATTVSESSQRRLSSSDVLEQPSALGFGFTDYRLVKTLFGDLSYREFVRVRLKPYPNVLFYTIRYSQILAVNCKHQNIDAK